MKLIKSFLKNIFKTLLIMSGFAIWGCVLALIIYAVRDEVILAILFAALYIAVSIGGYLTFLEKNPEF